jgi:hypothetical protein
VRTWATLLSLLLPLPAAAALCVNPAGTGGCLSSIAAALEAAVIDDVIDVAAGTYTESLPLRPFRVTIQGEDPLTTVVESASSLYVFAVDGPATDVTLRRLTIRGTQDGILVMRGGAVHVTESIITDNLFAGIHSSEGSQGTHIGGRIEVSDSVIIGNGIGIDVSPGRVKVFRSLITGNDGPGFKSLRTSRSVLFEDSTFSGNLGPGLSVSEAARVRIKRSTIANNAGGGIQFFDSRAMVRLWGTILADNGGADCLSGPTPFGRVLSRGFNLVETCPEFGGAKPTDLLATDPMLGPLADNGGPTLTHALLPGSPAIGAVIRANLCREPDQRGVPRAAPCDVGAYEAP